MCEKPQGPPVSKPATQPGTSKPVLSETHGLFSSYIHPPQGRPWVRRVFLAIIGLIIILYAVHKIL